MADKLTVFAFGKHKGKSFQEVADTDPSYCRWAQGTDNPSGALKDFVNFLKAGGSASSSQGSAPPRPRAPMQPSAFGGIIQGTSPSTGSLSTAVDPNFKFHGPRLDDETTIVLELTSADSFEARLEKHAGIAFGFKPKGFATASSGARAYVAPHVASAIQRIHGCRMAGGRFFFPRSQLDAVTACLGCIGKVEKIPDWYLGALSRAQKERKPDCVIEERLPKSLLPYQRKGVEFGLQQNGRCLIGDEMGLGKTLQALALATQYCEEWPVLVVCPSSLRGVWQEQALEWLPDFLDANDVQVVKKGTDTLNQDAHFWIISYTMMARDAKGKKHFQTRPDGEPHGIVIADESHNLKEWSSEKSKAVIPLLKTAKRAILLSGTPTRNSPIELHSQLASLIPRFGAKIVEFKSRYCIQSQNQVYGGRIVSQIVGARNAAELNFLLTETVMIRRLKKDVLQELPPKRRQKVPLEVEAKQMKEISKQMQGLGGDGGSWFISGDGENEPVESLFMSTAKAKLPAVKEYLLEVLQRGDEKAIIFAHHHLMLDEISALMEKELGKEGLYHVRIDGKVPPSKRNDLVKQFQTDEKCRIAVLSITACGEGLTLSAAGLVIFAELYWVPGAMEQAEARAHRIGNTHNKVIVEFLVVPKSPDERIYDALERKVKDTSKVMNGKAESLGALERLTRKRAQEKVSQRQQGVLKFPEPQAKKPKVQTDVASSDDKQSPTPAASSDDKQSPTPRKSEGAAETRAADVTPSPVPKWKVDMLIRAAKG